jgi:inhibitor of KinA sporulation pathway (predicted exonuclease)
MPRKLDQNVLVIDVESTCWEEPEKPGKDEISEIIEIGIAVVDINKLEIIKNDAIIIRPQRSRISNFCNKLTTITQEMVDQGMVYQAAMTILKQDYESSNRTFVSWGDYDRKMFQKNCQDYNVPYPFGPRHLNLKNCFTMLHGLEREPGMDSALDHIKLKLEGTHHRGVDDAKNIGNIFIHTLKKFRMGRPGENQRTPK